MNDISAFREDTIAQKFDGLLTPDSREGYSGYYVEPENLVKVVQTLRDQYHYDYLSMVTSTDYFPEDHIEAVYQLYKMSGGKGVNLKVKLTRDNPHVDSLVPLYPGAELQEREVYDMMGIHFDGHPDLRRILMWEGFNGYPLRKDWHEPYFEEETKPFKSRWPSGVAYRAEDKTPYKDNVSYPDDFDPYQCDPDVESALYESLSKIENGDDKNIKTERVIINLGPQHPSTHGVFRMATVLEGETIVDLKPAIGYLHRNHEKIGERNTYLQNMPFTDRLDYITSMINNFALAVTVEKLMGVKPPERAEYIRVMMAELTRILDHFLLVGFLTNDIGAFFTPALYAFKERELIADVFEEVSGSRMMCNYFRYGGVAHDLPDGMLVKISKLISRLERKIDEMDNFLSKNEILLSRCENVGILKPEDAIRYSVTGPVLRATGIPYDIRRADPYSIYDRLEFDVVTGTKGDTLDRYLVRLEEMRQSVRILKQIVRDIPGGPIQEGKPQYQVKVPPGEAYVRTESPKGELGFYIVSNGSINPWRYHVRAPTFVNLSALQLMTVGGKIADAVAVLGSVNITLGEVDR